MRKSLQLEVVKTCFYVVLRPEFAVQVDTRWK
jgi:hypothetical protein